MQGSLDPDNPRGRMADDLRAHLISSRPTLSEVLDLLGEPDVAKRGDPLSYNLGTWSGFRVDYDTLDVHFGSDGRVSEVWIVQH